MSDSLIAQRLVALFAAGWLVFDFPLLALWDRDATLLGIPLFPLSLFVVWAALIAALGLIVERSVDDSAANGERPGEPPPD